MSSLRQEESEGMPCTTGPAELVDWLGGLGDGPVTEFATYAAVGHGILQRP